MRDSLSLPDGTMVHFHHTDERTGLPVYYDQSANKLIAWSETTQGSAAIKELAAKVPALTLSVAHAVLDIVK